MAASNTYQAQNELLRQPKTYSKHDTKNE